MTRPCICVLLALLAVPFGLAYSQASLFEISADSAIPITDLDGDGRPDFVASNYHYLIAYSGDSGTIIWRTQTNTNVSAGKQLGALGDTNGDGVEDFLVSWAGFRVFIELRSGLDGSVLWTGTKVIGPSAFKFLPLTDIDGDGARDLLSIPPTSAVALLPVILSGRSGATISTLPQGLVFPHHSLSLTDDWDGDGVADLLVGKSGAPPSPESVAVYSLPGGALIKSFPSYQSDSYFGASVAATYDYDGDGIGEFYVGAPLETVAGSGNRGVVRLISSATSAELFRIDRASTPGSSSWFGFFLNAAGDLDGDGKRDVLVSPLSSSPNGRYEACSGVDGTLIGTAGDVTREAMVIPDWDGNGRDDYLFLSFRDWWEAPPVGNGAIVRLCLSGTENAQVLTPTTGGCASVPTSEGCTPLLDYSGAPSPTLGMDLTLHVKGVPIGRSGIFLRSNTWGGSTVVGGLTLCVGTPIHRMSTAIAGPDAWSNCPNPLLGGYIGQPVTKPELAGMGLVPGDRFTITYFFRDPGSATGMGTTNAIRFPMLP